MISPVDRASTHLVGFVVALLVSEICLAGLESGAIERPSSRETIQISPAAPLRGNDGPVDRAARWWAFQPLTRVLLGSVGPSVKAANPIDEFILAKSLEKGLAMAPPADKRTLIRRAYLDLLGLPPTPVEVISFIEDARPDAWGRLIDRLLASQHYGERWARHWLDVARFAESSGFEHDYDRPGAFHYRDFVIRALNLDLPFDDFARWQIAGDEFKPDDPQALTATGFLGAGVFPTQITANEVERTRYDALDDMLSTTASAFLGLTVGCARCHDHKYDPIPTYDYYRMLSTFTTTVRSLVDLDLDPEKTARLRDKWEAEHQPLVAERSRYDSSIEPAFDRWLKASAPLPETPTWIILDVTNLTSKAGATFKNLDDGSYLAEGRNGESDEYALKGSTTLRRVTGLRLEALAHPSLKAGGPGRADNGNIGLSRIRVLVDQGANRSSAEVEVARAEADFQQDSDSLSISAALDDEPKTGWAVDPQFGKDHSAVFTFSNPLELTNDARFTVKLEFRVNDRHNIGRPRISLTSDVQPSLAGEVLPLAVSALLKSYGRPGFATSLTSDERTMLFGWWKRRDPGWLERHQRVEAHASRQPSGKTKVLICAEGYPPLRMNTQGADFFPETYFLKRGSTDLKEGVASPGFLQALSREPTTVAHRGLPPPQGVQFSGRRRALANWLTDVQGGAGGLLARVMVNRLWQHHFGRGIVPTPNDFGRTGSLPTHPELLEWLAGELVRGGWRLKPLHRLIMTSEAYQQSGIKRPQGELLDPDNQLLCRRVPLRLEAESIRDSMLSVSGLLDATLYGPGTMDERSRRRSIYFTIKRSQLMGSMVAFDQPEPLVSQGNRPVTTVTPQALLILNGPHVREWAEAFARRVETELAPDDATERLVSRAYLESLGREPTREELSDAVSFIHQQRKAYASQGASNSSTLSLTDFCHVMFGLNEFAYAP
jgi:hypothetical protein